MSATPRSRPARLLAAAVRRADAVQDEMHEQLRVAYASLEVEIDTWRREMLASDPRYTDPRCLARYEHKVYSQDGSDGIVREIFARIGEGERYFVEFGIGNGLENNTAFLIAQGWRGLWIEGSPESTAAARASLAGPIDAGRLALTGSFVTAENIEGLFSGAGVPEEPAFMSIDIDGNDYWVWSAIERYRPRLVEIEYNGMFPPGVPWVKRYDPASTWSADSYLGASLESLARLGEKKGYGLVACTLAGTNAFFIRRDLLDEDAFVGPFTAERHYEPPRYHLTLERCGHPRSFGDAENV